MTERVEGGTASAGRSGQLIAVEAARARLVAALTPVSGLEDVPLRDALGRILGVDLVVTRPVPAYANSAMDGYALRGADLPVAGDVALRVVGDAFAGHPFAGMVGAGEAVRIMTGAVVPRGADTVVMQEAARREDGLVHIGAGQRPGQHVRQAGEDLTAGTVALPAGRRIGAAELGLIASLGNARVTVRRRLRVACFSTGDELRAPGEALGAGEIYDSNAYTVYGMLARFGAEVVDLGIVRDDRAALRAAFKRAADVADVVMTSGGVSVGAADFVKDVLAEVGEIDFWKVNIKPGKPIAFGRLHAGAAFFGLPGNPVSAMVTFYQLVQPALDHLAGAEPRLKLALEARAASALTKHNSRREYQRGVLAIDANGRPVVTVAAPQGSGILRSMSRANCFIVLPEECGSVGVGEVVQVEPFAGLI